MKHTLEHDPEETVHDGRCPLCGSPNIEFMKDLGMYPVNLMYEGKPCQRIKKSLWHCKQCWRSFASNKFITQ
jgi:C4-type Zn-finger protein